MQPLMRCYTPRCKASMLRVNKRNLAILPSLPIFGARNLEGGVLDAALPCKVETAPKAVMYMRRLMGVAVADHLHRGLGSKLPELMVRIGVSRTIGCLYKALTHPISVYFQGDIIGDGTLNNLL